MRENSGADAVMRKFGAKVFFQSGEKIETPLGVRWRRAEKNVEVAFSGANSAAAALWSMTVMVTEEAAPGREKVMEPFGDEHGLVRFEGTDRGAVGGPGDVVPDRIRPVETRLEVQTERRSEVGKAKSDWDFAGDGAAVNKELAFGGGNQRNMRDDGGMVTDVLGGEGVGASIELDAPGKSGGGLGRILVAVDVGESDVGGGGA